METCRGDEPGLAGSRIQVSNSETTRAFVVAIYVSAVIRPSKRRRICVDNAPTQVGFGAGDQAAAI
ncbi:hypothetical protein OU790_16660 [Ruegeria sp. NA]|nr:hypothetical protein [Ruegeria sp. NA]MCX8955059.1 hypothetical protein [Ruegeria sp. NA]